MMFLFWTVLVGALTAVTLSSLCAFDRKRARAAMWGAVAALGFVALCFVGAAP